jgi:hypothetical protein
MKLLTGLTLLSIFFLAAGCSGLKLQPADFSWPVESVLMVNDEGNVIEERYSMEFNTKELFSEEFGDSVPFIGNEIRLIRDRHGFYFITARNFKNVYVFREKDGSLLLCTKIFISETGLQAPALNQRNSYIELVDSNFRANLTYKGIERGNK